MGLIHAAGVSPSQASPATVLRVDLYGTPLVLEEFGSVMARGGSGVVISSQSGTPAAGAHRRAKPGARHGADGGAARAPVRAARSDSRLTSRVPALEARQLAASDGRGGALGEARCSHQYDQPGDRHDAAREGRAVGPTRRGLPAHDVGLGGRAGRHARRGPSGGARCSWPRGRVHRGAGGGSTIAGASLSIAASPVAMSSVHRRGSGSVSFPSPISRGIQR